MGEQLLVSFIYVDLKLLEGKNRPRANRAGHFAFLGCVGCVWGCGKEVVQQVCCRVVLCLHSSDMLTRRRKEVGSRSVGGLAALHGAAIMEEERKDFYVERTVCFCFEKNQCCEEGGFIEGGIQSNLIPEVFVFFCVVPPLFLLLSLRLSSAVI